MYRFGILVLLISIENSNWRNVIRPAWRSGGILIRLRHVGVHAGVHTELQNSQWNQLSLAGPVPIIVYYSIICSIEDLSFILIHV